MMYYVYKHKFSNGVCYIGKGKDDRMMSDNRPTSVYWNNLFKKYGEPIRGILIENLSEEDAVDLEELIIAEYLSLGCTLCNPTKGGEGFSGGTMPESAKDALKKYWTGHKQSEVTKQKRNAKLKGQKRSQETVYKMQQKSYIVICVETGLEYRNAYEAARQLRLHRDGHINDVCKGKRKTAGGFTWKFKDIGVKK